MTAVIDEFLRKNGFGPAEDGTSFPIASPSKRPALTQSSLGEAAIPEEAEGYNTPRRLLLENYRHGAPQLAQDDRSPADDDALSAEQTPLAEEENAQPRAPSAPPAPLDIPALIKVG